MITPILTEPITINAPPGVKHAAPRQSRGAGTGRSMVLIALALAIQIGSPGIATAQAAEPNKSVNPCQVQPGSPGDESKAPGVEADPSRPSLTDCNGVLKPPVTADHDIVKPAPATGNTMVIPPGTLPQQPD